MGIVREDILIAFFLEVIDKARRIEKLTHQPKELVNQKCDIYEWRQNDEKTVT